MPNTFEEQAKDRFRKSQAFMQKATTLLQDDLVYRSALADAVSSIKNMLQGYLLLRVARTPESAVTQRWQEIAASNRMPDLIQACGEAGLDLRGLAVEIKRLNTERNYRTHDDPERLVDSDQAAHALDLAQTVQKRIRAANQGVSATDATLAANVRAATPADAAHRAPPHQQPAHTTVAPLSDASTSPLHDGATPKGSAATAAVPVAPPAHSTSAAVVTDNASKEADDETTPGEPQDDDPLSPDDTAVSIQIVRTRRRRVGRALLQTLIAALLVIAGVAAGAGLTLPVAMGHTPEWLSFATQFLPSGATPTPISTPVPTATPSPTTAPVTIGALTVRTAPCQAGSSTIMLQNTGSNPLRWALGAPDMPTATFSVGQSSAAAPTQFGALTAGASIAVSATVPPDSGTYRVVVVAPEGTVQLLLAAC